VEKLKSECPYCGKVISIYESNSKDGIIIRKIKNKDIEYFCPFCKSRLVVLIKRNFKYLNLFLYLSFLFLLFVFLLFIWFFEYLILFMLFYLILLILYIQFNNVERVLIFKKDEFDS